MPDRRESTDPTTAPRPVSDVLKRSAPSASGQPWKHQEARSSTTKPACLRREHIARLWQRMAAIYGHKWVSSYGADDSDDTWLRGLGDIAPQEVADGLSACIERADPWPPTLPEFRALCREPPDCRPHAAMYREFPKALPPAEMTPEQRAEAEARSRHARETLRAVREAIRTGAPLVLPPDDEQ